jgi:hypothetical protein
MITFASPSSTGSRHRRPAAVAVLAVLAAATLAALGAAAGAWAGWRGVPPMTFQTSSGLPALVAPGARLETVEQVSPFATWLNWGAGTAGVLPVILGSERFGTGYEKDVLRTGEPAGAVLDDAARRLASGGWTAKRGDDGVDATRNGLHLTVRVTGAPGDGAAATGSVTLLLQREEPDQVLPLALGGAALGALVGAFGAVLLGRRRGVVPASIWVAVVALAPLTVTGLGGLALRLTGVDTTPWQRHGVVVAALCQIWVLLVIAAALLAGTVVGLRRLLMLRAMRQEPRSSDGPAAIE